MAPIVIVGAGPAGMMLAYQLASNGIAVRVFERHRDFEREFRGEFVQPSLLASLEQLGFLAELRRANQVVPIRAVTMRSGERPFAGNRSADGEPVGHAVSQPAFLALVHRECSRFAHYRLDLGATVTRAIDEGGHVRGVVVRRDGQEESVDARLVIACNGRGSSLRKAAGIKAEEREPPYDLMWLRFDVSSRSELYPDSLDGFITAKSFYVFYPTHGQRVQVMWRRKRRHAIDAKAPADTLRAALDEDLPRRWRPLLELFGEQTERQVLHVVTDCLPRWSAPGLLFLGDAAHTMSPMGGQGLSIAVRDSIVAANHLVRADRAGAALDDALCARIEAERRPEIEAIQAFQVRSARLIDAPPPVRWLATRIMIPLATRLQGGSFLKRVQYGVTDVKMEFPVPIGA